MVLTLKISVVFSHAYRTHRSTTLTTSLLEKTSARMAADEIMAAGSSSVVSEKQDSVVKTDFLVTVGRLK